jgi:nucleoside-diphosphate-sugar epimerase
VAGFDVADGDDVRDADAVRAAAHGTEAIVHLAGLPDDLGAPAADVMAVNLLGTYNVLLAAREARVSRVVYASSGKALGMLERPPAYLPIDDAHPGLPVHPYGLAKWLSEECCRAFTAETGIATICLRPVLVLDADGWAALNGAHELPPARGPEWHLGVFVDVADVAEAVLAALRCPDPGHIRALLCADEIAARRPTAELVAEHLPQARWRDGAPYPAGSRRALVDTAVARDVLGWRPRRGWP